MAGLDDRKADLLGDRLGGGLITLGDVDQLVEEEVLTETEAEEVNLTFQLGTLTQNNIRLTQVLKTGEGMEVGPVQSTRDLVGLDAGDWTALLTDREIEPPAGKEVSTYAGELARTVERIYPMPTLAHYTVGRKRDVSERLQAVRPVLETNAEVFTGAASRPGASFLDAIDFGDCGDDEIDALKADLTELTQFARTFRHLGVANVLDRADLTPEERADDAQRRIDAMTTFFDVNSDINLWNVDLLGLRPSGDGASAVSYEGIDADLQPLVRDQALAYQRVVNVAGTAATTEAALRAGYESSAVIAGDTPAVIANRLHISTDEAKRLRRAAVRSWSEANVVAHDLLLDREFTPSSARQAAPGDDRLREIRDVIGNANYCGCRHCSSVLSPAAYFVDLMRFVETHVLDADGGPFSDRPEHPIHLRTRRPDLWALPLTCENTDTLIPYLDVINEVLERHVADDSSLRTSRERAREAYQKLAALTSPDALNSFQQPFHLPLEELRVYLQHFDLTLGEIIERVQGWGRGAAREQLHLSPEAWTVVTTPISDAGDLQRLFGADTVDPMDVQAMLKATGLDRSELDRLLALPVIRDVGPNVAVEVVYEDGDEEQLRPLREELTGLNAKVLDRIHRFVRTWRAVPWTLEALDYVVRTRTPALFGDDASPAERSDALEKVAALGHLQARLDVPVDVLCGLTGALPTEPLAPDAASLFDRRFNPPRLAPTPEDQWGPGSLPDLTHPALLSPGEDAVEPSGNVYRLLGALGVGDAEFETLLRHLLALDATDGTISLTFDHLTLLYRHAQLAKRVHLAMDDLFAALRLVQDVQDDDQARVSERSDVEDLLDFLDWQQSSDLSIGIIHFVVRGPAPGTPDYLLDEEDLRALLKASADATQFPRQVFAEALGLEATDADEIVEELVHQQIIEGVPSATPPAYRVSESFDPEAALAMSGSASASTEEAEARAQRFNDRAEAIGNVLRGYLPEEAVLDRLAEALETTRETLHTLLRFAGVDATDRTTALRMVVDPSSDPDVGDLASIVHRVEETQAWTQALSFDDDAIGFVLGRLDRFGLTPGQRASLESLRRLSRYTVLREADAASVVDDLIADFGTRENDIERLAQLTDTTLIQAGSVYDTLPLAASVPVIDRVAALLNVLTLSRRLGVDGRTIGQFAESSFDTLASVRDLVLGAFRAKYDDETEFEEIVEPYRDRLRGRRRDALADYLITLPGLPFDTHSDLYHYFLLDTELEGCARSSRIVAATNSVQLYVQRCLMGLEQDEAGEVRVVPPDEMVQEWAWRKNYRVWEANRKVFLYPENYADPDLRDNKSPLFEELEGELLQQDVTKEAVEAAYKKYLKGFMEVASLKIVGSCYDAETRTTHLFGRSTTEPGRLFYRAMRKAAFEFNFGRASYTEEWTLWEKVEVKADAEQLSPIVIDGKLHLMWVESRPRTETTIKDGSSSAVQWTDLFLKVCIQKEDGTWGTPTELPMRKKRGNVGGFSLSLFPFPENGHGNGGELRYVHLGSYNTVTSVGQGSIQGEVFAVNLFNQRVFTRGSLAEVDTHPVRPFSIYNERRGKKWPYQHRLGVATLGHTSDYEAAVASIIIWSHPERGLDSRPTGGIALTRWNGGSPSHSPVIGSSGAYVLRSGQEEFLLDLEPGGKTFAYPGHAPVLNGNISPLTTSAAEKLARRFYRGGLSRLLSLESQRIAESPFPHSLDGEAPVELLPSPDDRLDFDGAFGVYYRELFFHIPRLIAHHLNANGRFEEAQQWYHYIFDPTTSETNESDDTTHYWRYLELRDPDDSSLGDVLSNKAALEAYRRDPFNPHAIARIRQGAYRNAVVMDYIDNLIDWGDHLFGQDTRESINEASLLYVMASDLLGDRPAQLGSCDLAGDEADEDPVTYARIESNAGLLATVENVVYSVRRTVERDSRSAASSARRETQALRYESYVLASSNAFGVQGADDLQISIDAYDLNGARTSSLKDYFKEGLGFAIDWMRTEQERQVFCVPPNETLAGYWDRVEDRLFKIRNCMNLSGVRRELALFAPPIDPGFLVRAKAAGLTLAEALSLSQPSIPPYRFTYLLGKAKEYAAAVRGFGGALLAALEKKDAAELTLLRSVHQQNILKLTRELKETQIKLARESREALERGKETMTFRQKHYKDLLDNGRNTWEVTQTIARHAATSSRTLSSLFYGSTSLLYLVPQLGSPFAIKYGGKEVGDSAKAWGQTLNTVADIAENVSTSAGLQASFSRREEGWTFQRALAKKEIAQINQQIVAADLRVALAERELEVHEATVEQTDEVYQFYKDQFTNLGLYTWLAKELSGLCRTAYNMAHDVARMAQAAYQYERDDGTAFFIEPGHWDSRKAGLLAGERLQLQLSQMEKAYLETNRRDFEVDQTFSLGQLDPIALHQLREEGNCSFSLSELAYDIAYPGQYRRRIKSVRLTIPCVTGPYVNVNAKLTLTQSRVRKKAPRDIESPTGEGRLVEEPRSRNVSIATSRAQNDGGVFEISFRGERYMPFEGAGAVSDWKLELPGAFRTFDYDTISDVLVHVSYTAKEDGRYRDLVETKIKDILTTEAETRGIQSAVSLKQQYASSLHVLFREQSGDGASPRTLPVGLTERTFPYFLRGKTLVLKKAAIALKLHDLWENRYKGETLSITLKTSEGANSTSEKKGLSINGSAPVTSLHSAEFTDIDGTLIKPGTRLPIDLQVEDTDLDLFLASGENGRAAPTADEVIDDLVLILTVGIGDNS